MTKWWVELHEQIIIADTEQEALEKFRAFLKALGDSEIYTKKEEVYSNPQLDEYVTIWKYSLGKRRLSAAPSDNFIYHTADTYVTQR